MRVRPIFAVLCCFAVTALMIASASVERFDLTLIAGIGTITFGAGVLLALRPFWAALAGRGLAWTALALLTLCDTVGPPRGAYAASAFALCAALLALGGHALDRAPSTFQPSHHRGPLILALVLGFADVATLSAWSLLAINGAPMVALTFFAITAAIAVSLYGLYRLRTWGFLLDLAVNAVVTGLMLADVFKLDAFRLVFLVPAVAQILIALPLLVAIVRRRPIAAPAVLARIAGWLPTTTVLVMVALNVQVWFGTPVLAQLVRWGWPRY